MAEITLAQAADELGLGASTLRAQVKHGRLRARLVGKTWVVTEDEVERYRRDSRGRVGRPRRTNAGGTPDPAAAVVADRLAALAQQFGIETLSIFGSVARGEAGPDSDVDIVIALEPSSRVGLLEHARIADELSRAFGRRVDLVTWKSLRPRMRETVEREAVRLFPR